jgi:hypothetical protein
MANDHVGSYGGKKRLLGGSSIDEDRLALILAQPTWNQEQAQEVLAAQVHSGLTIAQFATQRELTAGRLYNWKTKLQRWAEPGQPTQEPEAEPDKPATELNAQLDPEDPGERFMYEYVQRATQGPEPMWRLLNSRRQGAVLLCVVQWVQRVVEPGSYSLVQLELTEPALRWNDFPTAEAATQALEQRCSVPEVLDGEAGVASLLKVQVRGQAVEPQAKGDRPREKTRQDPCMTICMPSGVRIEIASGVPKALMRTVLRTLGAPSC